MRRARGVGPDGGAFQGVDGLDRARRPSLPGEDRATHLDKTGAGQWGKVWGGEGCPPSPDARVAMIRAATAGGVGPALFRRAHGSSGLLVDRGPLCAGDGSDGTVRANPYRSHAPVFTAVRTVAA